jgi:hypothetical protein
MTNCSDIDLYCLSTPWSLEDTAFEQFLQLVLDNENIGTVNLTVPQAIIASRPETARLLHELSVNNLLQLFGDLSIHFSLKM